MKKFLRKHTLWFVILGTTLTSVISYGFIDEYFELSKNLDIFSSVYREVNMYYVDPTDPGKLMKKGIDSMLETLDPYTNYIPESDIEDFRFLTTGQYGGIGALIKQKGDNVIISDPYEGYPAQKAGLLAGDLILEIDGKAVNNKKTDDISRLLKGSPKTQVHLLIQREGESAPFEKTITREEIKVKSVPYYGMVSDDIAYIRLNSFTENSGRDVGAALKELKSKHQLKGLVFDLRNNPGGLLNEAVNVSNLFVERGQDIVSTKGRLKDLDRTYKALNEAVDPGIALAVLVNSGSASASEIVSGSLQDLDRAVIVGQRTFGKGLVQTTRPLSYNTQLKITTAKYYVPSGRCIQALDYSHRNEDGSVGKVPDSLLTEFSTRAGRKVFDGGGILPDVSMDATKLSNISVSLLNKNLIFDYATRYRRAHPEIASVNDFVLTDADFNDFANFLSDKDYDYTTRSEKAMEDLKKNSEDEKYYTDIQREYEALKLKLAHNKQADVEKNKNEILQLLEEEIISRYYYQSGRIETALQHDAELKKAMEIIHDQSVYSSILKGSLKADAGKK
ncbi:MAG: PDZ domain-containing protein [Bacteroidetes bacterium]|nr:PDZ domain-containing protein [Bacteroidota bacterium]MBK9523756.1 PDZ domain-containing protein [Bacteroidota bacterium]MBK9541508.1 PDZ domain-containing protein [Bacteroidota bacterium]